MIVARCNFGTCKNRDKREDFSDLTHSYMASLLHNWQVLDHYDLAWQRGTLWAYAPLPRRDSIEEHFHSSTAQLALDELSDFSGQEPEWEILDDESDEEVDNLSACESLVLITSFLDIRSPLISLTERSPLALCALEIPESLRDDAFFWNLRYKSFDSIFMGSGALETEAYQQISDVSSELTASGMEICAQLEKHLEKPTFYYLHSFSPGEMRHEDYEPRSCPKCGGSWLISPDRKPPGSYLDFGFRCDDCRLVGHHPTSFCDAEMAAMDL